MNPPSYSLALNDDSARKARRWLLLGVVALGVAGIFAGLLANTKSAFFYAALVTHVDLSVLVWFLTQACMIFTLTARGRGVAMIDDAAFYCFSAGSALIVASAFTGGEAYMSNYIPVIHHPLFFLGLSLLFCGVLGILINQLVSFRREDMNDPQRFGVFTAGYIMAIAILCFIASVHAIPAEMTGQIYYEYIFWGGGHVLQFVHTQLMLVCWLWLAHAGGVRIVAGKKLIMALYLFGLLAACTGIGIYIGHDPASDEHRNAFTMLMKHANGLPAIIMGVLLLWGSVTSGALSGSSLSRIALLMSILLFAAGGALGYLIAGSNVTVPAHYHGSIVGITLAFMGVGYSLLPSFGFADVSRSLLARAQPIVYGGGQLCWMAGMAILGAHGVPRKTPGSADTVGALASFLRHGGDGLALIGGLLFVFVVLRAVYQTKRTT